MNEKKSLVTWLGSYQDKWVNIMFKGQSDYEVYRINNVYPDGYVEAISEANEKGDIFLHMINLDDVSNIAIDIEETDVEKPEEA